MCELALVNCDRRDGVRSGWVQSGANASQGQVDARGAIVQAKMEKGIIAVGGHLPKAAPTGIGASPHGGPTTPSRPGLRRLTREKLVRGIRGQSRPLAARVSVQRIG